MQYKVDKVAFLILAIAAWIYIWLRAFLIPFQSDEAATFFMYVQAGQFFPPSAAIDANNHILNSILTWISYQLFGSSPLAMRLPNVISALVYYFFIFKLSELLSWKFSKWGFILFSLGTNFILEFFSYSRGYGLSMAFMVAALYELIILFKEMRLKRVILAVVFILLATAANLNLIFISLSVYFFLALAMAYHLKILRKTPILAGFLTILLIGGLSSAYFIHYSFQIREAAGFYYGSSAGFLKVTVESLAIMVAGQFKMIIGITAISAFIIIALITLFQLVMKKKRIGYPQGNEIFFLMLLISWIGSLSLNKIWQVNFQEDRAAMHLIPLFYGMIFFTIDSYGTIFRKYGAIFILPLLFILVYSIQQFSLKETVYGKSQQVPVEFFQFIKDDASRKPFPPVVSSYQARRQVWAFMNYRSGGLLNPLTVGDFPNPDADFLIDEFPLSDSLKNRFDLVLSDKTTQTGLYKNLHISGSFSSKNISLKVPVKCNQEYFELFKIPADSLTGKSLRIEIGLNVESTEKPLQAAVVVEVFDENRKSLSYQAIDLELLQPGWEESNHLFRHVMLFHDIPLESKTILLYIWNKNKVPVVISEGEATIKITN